MNNPIKKIVIPLLIIGVAIAGFVVLRMTKPAAKPVTINEKAWPVAVTAVTPAAEAPELTLYGRIEAEWSSTMTSALAADVVAVPVHEGDLVTKGAIVVRLDASDARLRLTQAEARIASEIARHQANLEALPRERNLLALARKELERARDLLARKLASQSALDTARQAVDRQAIALSARETAIQEHDARLAELTAARDQADLDVQRAQVRAPFDARVARLNVSPGQRLRVGDPVVTLYDTATLLVRAQIPEDQLGAINQALAQDRALSAEGTLDGSRIQATLMRLGGEAAAGGGMAGLFRVREPDGRVRPGRFLALTLRLPVAQDVIALPAGALYGRDRIYRVDDQGRLRSSRVQRVGERRAQGQSVLLVRAESLPPGTRVVTTQLPNAMDGLKVTVVKEDGAH